MGLKVLEPEEGYDLFAGDYKKHHGHLDSFDWKQTQEILWPLVDALKGGHYLDAGCGDGRTLVRVQRHLTKVGTENQAPLWGWDISQKMLSMAKKRLEPGPTLCKVDLGGTIPALSYPPGGFSLVTAFFLLVHFRDPRDLLDPLFKVMAPGGHLLCNSIPQKEGFEIQAGTKEYIIDYHHHEAHDVEHALEDSGFVLVQRLDTPWSTLFLGQKPIR